MACRQLGYNSVIGYGGANTRNFGNSWLNRLNCTGSEVSLSDCPHSDWGSGRCPLGYYPAGVTCINGTAYNI